MTLDTTVTNAETKASLGARTSADDPNLTTYSDSTEPMNAETSSQMGVLGSEGNTVTGKNIRTGLKWQNQCRVGTNPFGQIRLVERFQILFS